jgi:6-pyruvoyltetrahydropterin/6-carboxytetrahydropterin synthase
MSQPLIELSVDFVIECAHQMMEFPEGHPNRRIHGHTYYGVVKLVGSIDPETGYVMDAMELKQHLDPVVKMLDHQFLNDIPGLVKPSSEWIAVFLWEKLAGKIRGLKSVEIRRPSVGMSVVYKGEKGS